MRVYGLARDATRHLAPPTAVPVDCDITEPDAVQRALGRIAVDSTVHLAEVGRRDPVIDPDEAMRINVLGTHNLLDWAADCGTSRFVLASPTDHVAQPQGIDAISQCIAEQCSAFVARTTSMHVCSVRLGSLSDSHRRAAAAQAILAALEHTPRQPFEVLDATTAREARSEELAAAGATA